MACFPFRARLQDRPVQFHPVAADEVFAFASLLVQTFRPLFSESGGAVQGRPPGYLGFGAHILAGHIVALRAALRRTCQDQQTQAGDHHHFG